mgnify:CR=1 FL=1
MQTVTCTRRLEIDAAHRLVHHKSKCGALHGHRYRVEVTCVANVLSGGMVIDFSLTKSIFGVWLDEKLDHTAILNKEDVALIQAVNLVHEQAGKKPVYVVDFEPTSENLAWFFLDKANELLQPEHVVVSKVRVYETPNCWSDAELSSLVVNSLLQKAELK